MTQQSKANPFVIIKEVEKMYKNADGKLIEPGYEFAEARGVAMYFSHHMSEYSDEVIADHFNRNGNVVKSAIDYVNRRLNDFDEDFSNKINEISLALELIHGYTYIKRNTISV